MSIIGSAMSATAGSAIGIMTAPPLLAVAYAANEMCPIQVPIPEQVVELLSRGILTDDGAKQLFEMQGRRYAIGKVGLEKYQLAPGEQLVVTPGWYRDPLTVWGKVARASMYTPSIDETIALYRRKTMDFITARQLIKEQCNGSDAMAAIWLKMQYEIPGASDLIRFSVREAFDPATIQRFDYHKEFPAEILPWMEKQGYGEDTGIPRPPGSTDNLGNPLVGNCTWSDLYWYSHWELPSNTQGYEMAHRLYPASRYGPSPDIINRAAFTLPDLEALQKANDIPNYWRQRLQAISYHPLTRVDAKRMFESGFIDKEKVYHTLRAGGYNDVDAESMATWFENEKINKSKRPVKKIASDYVCTNLAVGTIDNTDAATILSFNGYTNDEIKLFIAKCDLTIQSKTITVGISALRDSYIKGGLSETELKTELTGLGISVRMVNAYAKRWTILKLFKYKLMSAQLLTKAYHEYLITDSDMVTKLSNLGYPKDETYLIINTARAKRNQTAIANAKATLREIQARIKAANAAAKAVYRDNQKIIKEANKKAESAAKKRIRGLIAGASDANIKKWYEAGLIMIDEIAFRLILRDYSLIDVSREIQLLDPSLAIGDINGEISKAAKVYIALGYPPPTA